MTMETHVFLGNMSDDDIMSETHEMIMRRKRVMMTMTSAKKKRRRKIMIKRPRLSCWMQIEKWPIGGNLLHWIFLPDHKWQLLMRKAMNMPRGRSKI